MKGLLFVLRNFEEIVGSVLLAVMVVVVFTGVVFRYLLNNSLPWPEELARILFGWITFIGASAVLKRRGHLGVDTLLLALKPGQRFVVLKVVDLLLFVVLVVLLVYGLRLVENASFLTTATMSFPWRWIYAVIPFSAALMIVHLVRNVIVDFRERGATPSEV